MHTRATRFSSQLLPLLVLCLAFGLRMHGSETGWIFKDQTYLRGQGLFALDNIANGRWSELPIFTYASSSGLFNPALMVYVWAALAAIDKGQLFATIVNLMIDFLSVPMVYALARATTNRSSALLAMTLAAVSPWAIGVARGTWQPGQLAVCFALVAWLVIGGMVRERPRWIVAGFAAAAVLMWTYTLAFALVAQAALASLILFKRSLTRPVVTGWIIAGLSTLTMFGLAYATGQISGVSRFANWATNDSQNLRLTGIVDDPFILALRLNSWFDYVRAWVDAGVPLWPLGQGFNFAWSVVIMMLTGIGLLSALVAVIARKRSLTLAVALSAWFLLPVATFALMRASTGGYLIQQYYLMLSVPAGYLLPAWVLHVLAKRIRPVQPSALLRLPITAAVLAAFPFAAWTSLGAAQSARAQGYVGTLVYMPLHEAERLSEHWRGSGCELMHAARYENDMPWIASLWRRPDNIRDEYNSEFTAESSVWALTPGQTNCLMLEEAHALPMTAVTPYLFANGKTAYDYRANAAVGTTPDDAYSSNIGWSLIDLRTPMKASAGMTTTVSHIWRIDSLPGEPYTAWYFAPNVKLVAADGRVVGEYWGKSILGSMWRAGDEVRSGINMHIPADVAPGDYILKVSLFDPNQKKNAVYFSAQKPGEPIVIIERPIRITAH